jgi:hypothetical protein
MEKKEIPLMVTTAHRLAGLSVLDWEIGGERFVRVQGGDMGTISHEDHDPKPVAVVHPGQTYEVRRQRELDLSGEWRQVAD